MLDKQALLVRGGGTCHLLLEYVLAQSMTFEEEAFYRTIMGKRMYVWYRGTEGFEMCLVHFLAEVRVGFNASMAMFCYKWTPMQGRTEWDALSAAATRLQ